MKDEKVVILNENNYTNQNHAFSFPDIPEVFNLAFIRFNIALKIFEFVDI